MKKRAVVAGVLATLVAGSVAVKAHADEFSDQQSYKSPLSLSISYEPFYYKWKESGGVKEGGWVHAAKIGASYDYCNITTKVDFSIFGGEVDYDGATWGGTPVDTNTNYNGWKLEGKVGYDLVYGNTIITPYIGIGYEYWKRDIEGKPGSTTGYGEQWKYGTFKAGVSPEYVLGKYKFYGDFSIHYPWKVENKVDAFNVELEPDKKLGYGIEIGMGKDNFIKNGWKGTFGAFYIYDSFGESSSEYSNIAGGDVYQPDSTRRLIGLKVKIDF